MRLDPLGDGLSSVELVDHMGNDMRVVQAARVSLAGDQEGWREEKDPRLIRYLLKAGHWSPFEHPQVTLRITCPLFVRSQWMRHRHSFNEVSARYTEVEEEFYMPLYFREQAESNRQASVEAEQLPEWHAYNRNIVAEVYQEVWSAYQELLRRGVAREQARMVLPQAAYTHFYVTANLRSWLHFLQVRDHAGAQHEMVQFARAVAEILEPLFPVTFAAWRDLNHKEQV